MIPLVASILSRLHIDVLSDVLDWQCLDVLVQGESVERSAWRTNTGFLLLAIGSAVGLGNTWRFSYLAYKNGGGTFLIPYAIALFSVGIPILILEFAIGHKMRTAAPKAMALVHRKWEWLGWWPVIFVGFGIVLYYVVVIGWFGLYMLYSADAIFGRELPWAGRSEEFFFQDFLHLSGGAFERGGVQPGILCATAFFWVVLCVICWRQVDKGVELACRVFMPLLVVLTTTLVFWGLTLDGAMEGLLNTSRRIGASLVKCRSGGMPSDRSSFLSPSLSGS